MIFIRGTNGRHRQEDRRDAVRTAFLPQCGKVAYRLCTIDARAIVVHPTHDDEDARGKRQDIPVKTCEHIPCCITTVPEVLDGNRTVCLPVIERVRGGQADRTAPVGDAVPQRRNRRVRNDIEHAAR